MEEIQNLKMKKREGEEEDEEEKKEMNRKEKRKAMKKMKRKNMRKQTAAKERAEEEARLNDPEEQRRMQLLEQQEAERMERDRILFEERERALMMTLESQQSTVTIQHQQQSPQMNLLEESESAPNDDDDDQWEYVEDGPPEIIWQGNEIIFKRNKVRVKVSNKQPNQDQHQVLDADDNRPTSNPFPPESHTNSSTQQALENVAQQVPNFGTEQDKAHCPFHLKTGVCRFGQRCSRVHFYPDKSCTLLMKNMYNGPGLAWEQDEGLEYTDEEVERCFEEFYEDVHTEFMKFGEIVNFKVCKNGSFHLRGNVYVQYKVLDSALLAYNTVNGRYFAGKQVNCSFINLNRWKVAICGEFMKSGYKTCSHGTACNFIHCFRNPGGDYEWADSDRPPPKYWVEKMVALFGYSDDYEASTERENLSVLRNTGKMSKTDSDRHHSSRSRYRDLWDKGEDRDWCDKDEDRENERKHPRKSSFDGNKNENRRRHDKDFHMDGATTKDNEIEHEREQRNSRKGNRDSRDNIYETELDGDRKRHHSSRRKSSRHHSKDTRTGEAESRKISLDRGHMETHDCSRKSSRHKRSGLQDENKDRG